MIKYIHFVIIWVILFSGLANAQVMSGLDNLVAENFTPLKGKHVGLITNQTGRSRDSSFGADLFLNSNEMKLVALFAP